MVGLFVRYGFNFSHWYVDYAICDIVSFGFLFIFLGLSFPAREGALGVPSLGYCSGYFI